MNMSLPLLKASPAGRIINVSSMIGPVGNGQNSLCIITKGAMLLFTKSLAAGMAKSVSPGIFMTDMNAKFTQEQEKLATVEKNSTHATIGKTTRVGGCRLVFGIRRIVLHDGSGSTGGWRHCFCLVKLLHCIKVK